MCTMSELHAASRQPSERKRLTSGRHNRTEGSGGNYLLAAVEGLDDSRGDWLVRGDWRVS